ncbi:18079_t:CDS:2 [Funneliformis geosporum]|uniref:7056_t:CDS:1 n=1 Tax=Funneliformis geosporum TaxID=1117311 RepID=A0A9W4SJN9_9GLOM|nr:18079_t:CDS:2 [Funneliformis geosporum]CAI2170901.1 7056_t:CDS:2 [Funneliformis geosporum]
MVKGSRQKHKHRFHKQISSNNYAPTIQHKDNESTNQVSSLLDKLRKEVRFNNGSSSVLSPTLPQPAFNYLMREHAEREQQEREERDVMRQRVSGPVPPKSWLVAWKGEVGKVETMELLIKERKEKRKVWDESTLLMREIPTLLESCLKIVAINVKSYISCPYFSSIPTHLKQLILSFLSIYNPLNEEILPLFTMDTEYEELDLANSSINFERLRKSFWKIVRKQNCENNLVEDWEDLVDQNDEYTDVISYRRTFSKQIDLANEDDTSSENSKKTYISKLPKLRRLNLAFNNNIPGIPLSFLLDSTLPLLTHLSIAGCFNREDGPHSLRILSGLINLLFLDVSYCGWVTDQIILQVINWDRDLKSLRILAALNCGNWKDVELVRKTLSKNRRLFELWTR